MVKMLVKNYLKSVVNGKKLLKMVKNVDFSKFVKNNGEMLKNVGENIKKFYCTDHFLHSGY